MSVFGWTLKHYDKAGAGITANDYVTGTSPSNQIKYAYNRSASFPLNAIDTVEFDLPLHDPMAAVMATKTSFVKLWRTINDVPHSRTYTSPSATPDFAGIVTGIDKFGSDDRMHVTVQGVLWRLQCHFHINNHHLVLDVTPSDTNLVGSNEDDLVFDQSALMWRLIALINEAFFGTGGYTGIKKPLTRAFDGGTTYWPKTIDVAPYFVAKGSNTWSNFYDDLMSRAAGVDLIPQYIHVDGSPDLMYFATDIKRGSDISASVSLNYHTGVQNLDECTESRSVRPGVYANYVWVVGEGGPNVYAALAEDVPARTAEGIFMKIVEVNNVKMTDQLDAQAVAELDKAKKADAPVYTAQLSPAVPPYFKSDFDVGDVVMLNANKGALAVSSLKQRIYQVDLAMTDNNTEIASLQISADFLGKIV